MYDLPSAVSEEGLGGDDYHIWEDGVRRQAVTRPLQHEPQTRYTCGTQPHIRKQRLGSPSGTAFSLVLFARG